MKTRPNFQDADAFYEQLLDAHQGLSREQSEAFNARLILVLANQLGDTALLSSCIEAAHSSTAPEPTGTGNARTASRPVE